jgi:hypothetical protein
VLATVSVTVGRPAFSSISPAAEMISPGIMAEPLYNAGVSERSGRWPSRRWS